MSTRTKGASSARQAERLARLTDVPTPSAVALDLDGTLVDTVPARMKAWIQALSEAGIVVKESTVAILIGSDGRHVAREAARVARITVSDPLVEAIDLRQGKLFEALSTDPAALPGSREFLTLLDSRAIPWAIATSSRPEQVSASVRALDLPHRPRVIDASGVEKGKPAPDLLLKAARELGVRPERCWYVGDSTWDMKAALAAGTVGIGVTAGSAVTSEDLKAAGASAVCETLRQVSDLLRAT